LQFFISATRQTIQSLGLLHNKQPFIAIHRPIS